MDARLNPIQKLSTWHAGAVERQREADQKRKELEAQAQKKRDQELYQGSIETFNKGFDKLSALDQKLNDVDRKAGEVKVPGVGSLKKTAEGFVMELLKNTPIPVGAFGAPFMGAVPQARAYEMGSDVFTVNEKSGTITHDIYTSPAIPDLGRVALGGAAFGGLSNLGKTKVASRTLDVIHEELVNNTEWHDSGRPATLAPSRAALA